MAVQTNWHVQYYQVFHTDDLFRPDAAGEEKRYDPTTSSSHRLPSPSTRFPRPYFATFIVPGDHIIR